MITILIMMTRIIIISWNDVAKNWVINCNKKQFVAIVRFYNTRNRNPIMADADVYNLCDKATFRLISDASHCLQSVYFCLKCCTLKY